MASQSQAQLNPEISVEELFEDLFSSRWVGNANHTLSINEILRNNNNGLPNIILIGYWPPTNDMVREFSPYLGQNPQGWIGKNWENLGYNIYSFFPEFPGPLGKGEGDFQVDYQKTSEDFWKIIPKFNPVALLSFGRASNDRAWEIETNYRNLKNWMIDYLPPRDPTPTPPDSSLPPESIRRAIFPGIEIVKALKSEKINLKIKIDTAEFAGAFLCEFLGYHLNWYRELYPDQMRFAAHTHIGSKNSVNVLKKALKISLKTLIKNLEK